MTTARTATRLVTHSVRAMRRYRLRSGFMMLGSLIGVAALTLVVSIGAGAQRKIMSTMRQLFGASSILVFARGVNFMGGPRPDAARLTIDDLEAVADRVPEIAAWDPQQTMPSASVRRGEASTTARVVGASERTGRVWNRAASRGEYFDAAAIAGSARVALIGETVRTALFQQEDPIGGEILVGAVPFRVIGLLEPFGTDVHGMDRDNEVVVPITTMMRRVMNVDTISMARLLVRDASQGEAAATAIRAALRERHAIADGRRDDFTMVTPVEVQHMVSGVQRAITLYVPLVAGVALLVGGIVAATLMLVSVNERVGEIGLRRAVGARPEDIRLQFLVETASTTAIGGLAGVAIGYAGAFYVARQFHLGDIFSWSAVGIGVVMSVVVGLLAGVMPARRAARMQPADALR